jgi:hypothetical protein
METWTIRVCNKPVNVRVLGYNLLTQQWDDVCFENTFNCDICCKDVDVSIISLGSNEQGCCVYRVIISNGGDCVLNVFNNGGQIIGSINPQSGINEQIVVCPTNNPGALFEQFTISTQAGIVCKTFNLSYLCE